MDLDNTNITDLDFGREPTYYYVTLGLRGASENLKFLAKYVFRQDGFLTIEHLEGTIQHISETDVISYSTKQVSADDLSCDCGECF